MNKNRDYTVYGGLNKKKELVYIGTTIQYPPDRFRWHKHNGKNLDFFIMETSKDKEAMLNLEFELIKKHNPKLNKIKHRKQNFNVRLSGDEVGARRGNKEWCQSCLKRRVNKGYDTCYWCN